MERRIWKIVAILVEVALLLAAGVGLAVWWHLNHWG